MILLRLIFGLRNCLILKAMFPWLKAYLEVNVRSVFFFALLIYFLPRRRFFRLRLLNLEFRLSLKVNVDDDVALWIKKDPESPIEFKDMKIIPFVNADGYVVHTQDLPLGARLFC